MGISQEQLAERADLHRTYVSDVERGARNLSLESITRLARALDVSVSTLFPTEFPAVEGGEIKFNNRDYVDILLVEDNPDDAEMALHAFKQARFSNRVKVINDGSGNATINKVIRFMSMTLPCRQLVRAFAIGISERPHTSFVGSAFGFGRYFCVRPPNTSERYRFPSESAVI